MHKNLEEEECSSRKVKNDKDETITSKNGSATVFGELYSKLYAEERFGEEVQDPHKSDTRTNTEGESCNDDKKKRNTRVHTR